MDELQLVHDIEKFLDAEASAGRFSGTLLVARGEHPVLTTARGWAIQPGILANRPDTKFNIASLTKMLTAVAVLQLVAGGKLDLHAPVAACRPDLPHAGRVSIHQLLTHTAGFGRYWNDAYRAARSDLRTIGGYLGLFADEPLAFEPGTRHQYGNSGYVLLGALIEQVSGLSYYDYMRERLFFPLGMLSTDFCELDLPVENCAVGYTRESWFSPTDGQLRANTFIYAVRGSPSEHCFSTAEDLFRFTQALQNHMLLDPTLTELCFTPHASSEKPGVSYGYGVHIIDDGARGRMIGHGGRAMGGDAFALMYLDLGYTVICLSNYDRPAARRVIDRVADLLVA